MHIIIKYVCGDHGNCIGRVCNSVIKLQIFVCTLTLIRLTKKKIVYNNYRLVNRVIYM